MALRCKNRTRFLFEDRVLAKQVFKSTKKAPISKADATKKAMDFSVNFEEGEVIFNEGDLGVEMFILQEGNVEVYRQVNDEHRELAVLEKGDFFGEMSLLEGLPRTATAAALTNTKLLRINGSTFDQMLRSKPEIAVRIMRKLSCRLRETERLLQKAYGSSVVEAHEATPKRSMATKLHSPKTTIPYRLRHQESGDVFPFSTGSEFHVGRRDAVTGIHPDCDMTEVDVQRSTSRQHAKIVIRGEQFFLIEEIGTMNGTFVNNDRLETGESRRIVPGDEVQFGLVKMVFEELPE